MRKPNMKREPPSLRLAKPASASSPRRAAAVLSMAMGMAMGLFPHARPAFGLCSDPGGSRRRRLSWRGRRSAFSRDRSCAATSMSIPGPRAFLQLLGHRRSRTPNPRARTIARMPSPFPCAKNCRLGLASTRTSIARRCWSRAKGLTPTPPAIWPPRAGAEAWAVARFECM